MLAPRAVAAAAADRGLFFLIVLEIDLIPPLIPAMQHIYIVA